MSNMLSQVELGLVRGVPFSFYIMWTAVYMCTIYLVKLWHLNALWDDDKPMAKILCSG